MTPYIYPVKGTIFEIYININVKHILVPFFILKILLPEIGFHAYKLIFKQIIQKLITEFLSCEDELLNGMWFPIFHYWFIFFRYPFCPVMKL